MFYSVVFHLFFTKVFRQYYKGFRAVFTDMSGMFKLTGDDDIDVGAWWFL